MTVAIYTTVRLCVRASIRTFMCACVFMWGLYVLFLFVCACVRVCERACVLRAQSMLVYNLGKEYRVLMSGDLASFKLIQIHFVSCDIRKKTTTREAEAAN